MGMNDMQDSNNIYKLLSTSSLSSDDLLVMSQQDKYSSRIFNSCSVRSSELIDMLFQRVLQMQNFSSTVHMQSADFSPYDHNHDSMYNKLSLDFAYMSQSTHRKTSRSWLSSSFRNAQLLPNAAALSIGNVFFDGTLVPVDVALSSIRRTYVVSFKTAEPDVGSLKFVASSTIRSNSSINYKSDDFDGWLYPDGSTFDLTDFALSTQLKQLYGNKYSSKFTLPDFRRFMKLNGTASTAGSSMIGVVQGINVLKRHSHQLASSLLITASLKIKLACGAADSGSSSGISGNRGLFYGAGKVAVTYRGDNIPYIDNRNGNLTFGKLIKLYGNTFSNTNDTQNYPWPVWDSGQSRVQLSRSGLYALLQKLGSFNGMVSKGGITVSTDYNAYAATLYNVSKINLPPMSNFTASANVSGSTSATLQQTDGEIGETYPSHIILPVMIYVGQRRRSYYA